MSHRRRAAFMAFGISAALALASCGWLRSGVNDSPSVRWWLFSNFGVAQICPKVLSSGIPLRLTTGGPAVGRYFPNGCSTQVNEPERTIRLALTGTGYAWTPVAGRIGFLASATVDYAMDFRLEDDAMYVWGVPSGTLMAPTFQLGAIENPVVNWAAQGPAGYLAATFGRQILESQLGQGFTAIRTESGDEFALGRLVPPARPKKPFGLASDERLLLEHDVAELRMGQVDTVGPLDVAEDDQALFIRLQVDGPSADALVYPRHVIEPWREGLQTGAALRSPGVPLAAFALPSGQAQSFRVPLPRGSYILVLDHSTQLGSSAPPFNLLSALGSGSTRVSYAIELGEADD